VDGTPDDASGNSLQVVFFDGTSGANITSSTRLDGFTITAGNANISETNAGGGVTCSGSDGNECSPTFANVTFRDNRAEFGGAMLLSGASGGKSSPIIQSATFVDNRCYEDGGAIYNNGDDGESNPTIINSTFTGNTATSTFGNGGAIYSDGESNGVSSPVIRNVVFTGNVADSDGGAIYNNASFGRSSPTLVNTTFAGNSTNGGDGGAVVVDAGGAGVSVVRIAGSTFTQNESGGGGAVWVRGIPVIVNTTFAGNDAEFGGALFTDSEFAENGSGSIANVVFSGNTASEGSGGAIYVADESAPEITGSTFSNNVASANGGAIYNDENSNPTIANSILFGNTASGSGSQMFNEGESTEPTLSYSLVEDGCRSIPGTICNRGNTTGDPQFASTDGPDGTPGTADDDLRLQGPGSGDGPSPAIDAGNNSAVPDTIATDATGEMERLFDVGEVEDTGDGDAPVVDMGAYESDGSPLPVELAAFSGQADGRAAVLEWKTLSETNNEGFYVERKTESGSWTTVGEQVEGAGTSQEAHRYSRRVEDLNFGAHTFRLRQIDADGGEAVLDQRARVEVKMSEKYLLEGVYPNPFRERATVEFAVQEPQAVTVALYDARGRRVRLLKDGKTPGGETVTLRLQANDLASGVYFVRLRGEDFAATETVTLVR
jgi:predicted outer membrane repeat protein